MCYYKNLERFKDKVALLEESGNSITYSELAKIGDDFSKVLKKRALVFTFCSNEIGSVAGYLSILNSGSVQVLLDSGLAKELISDLLDNYNPNYVYVPDEIAENFEGEVVYEDFAYKLIKRNDNDIAMNDELALMLTTSGSTGSPKFVRQSYANIDSNSKAIATYLEIDDTERPITTLPMNYTYGLSVINSHVLKGATILLAKSPVVSGLFWKFFKEKEATSFGGVPFTYEMLKKIRFMKLELPSLRYMTQAGGKLPAEMHKEFAEYAIDRGVKFVVMYGQTEATARMSYLPADKSLEKYGSVGIAIPGGRFALIDVDGNEFDEPEKTGELVYVGDNVTLGYALTLEDLTKGDERGGRLETGDMAKRDEDGYYYIVGRKKRFLKLYGSRVNLDEVDGLVKKQYPDIDCASTGDDSALILFITNEELCKEVRKFLIDRTHINPKAVKVRFIEEIPRSEAGKVMYKDLPTEE